MPDVKLQSRSRPYLLLGLLALCAVFGAYRLYFADRNSNQNSSDAAIAPASGEPMPDIATRAHAPSAMAESKWLRERTSRYRSLLTGWHCDTLVLPVQVEESAFDRPTRALMAGDIALALQGQGNCVTDPMLMDLALGEGMRRYPIQDITALAHELKAKTVVLTWTGHDAAGHIRVTLQVAHPAEHEERISPIEKISFDDLAYTDRISPFDAFHKNILAMLKKVGLSAAFPSQRAAGSLSGSLPSSPADLLKTNGTSALEQAARMTLLGILAPRNDSTAGDRLFAKALLILSGVDTSPEVERLRAHVLLGLHERPYALAAIDGLQGPEADGLRAVLNGNLPAAHADLAKVSAPWERLFLAIEVYDLELDYERDGDKTASLFESALGPDWASLLYERRADDDQWIIPDPIAIKKTLDATFPIPGQSLQELAQGSFILLQMSDEADFDQTAVKHTRALIEHHGHDFCCSTFALGPNSWDLLDLLDNRSERALLKQAYYYVNPQGLFQRASDLLARYDDVLAGNPYAEGIRAMAIWYPLNSGETTDREKHIKQMHTAARIAAVTAPGQTQPVVTATWFLFQPPAEPYARALSDAYCEDYPMRAFWNGNPQTLKSRLLFSTSNIAPLDDLLKSSNGSERAKLLKELSVRFDGNSRATTLRLQQTMGADKVDPAALRSAIVADPENWDLYKWLGNYYVEQGNFEQASDLIASFPAFAAAKHRTVELANHAAYFGRRLYWLGEIRSARPLLKIAADYDNGSGASNNSRAMLAVLDKDYSAAAMTFFESGRHYNDLSDYGHFLELLFGGGESKAAWEGFDQLVRRNRGPELWDAALIGHRRDDRSPTQLREWIARESASGAFATFDQPLARLALMDQLMDRDVPPPDFAEYIAKLAGPSDVQIAPDGKGVFGKFGRDQRRRIGPSEFGQHRRAPIAKGTVVPNRYALFADAYVALQGKHFGDAATKFDRLAAYYNIEDNADWGFALPYFAFAAAQSGDTFGLEKYLNGKGDAQKTWGMLLARAVLAGARGDLDASDKLLEKAHLNRPYTGDWPVMTAYQYAQSCMWIYELTKDNRFRDRALNWARAYTQIAPVYGWAHALVALLSSDSSERVRELAYALYLDPQSAWAAQSRKTERAEAEAWLKVHQLFRLRPHDSSA